MFDLRYKLGLCCKIVVGVARSALFDELSVFGLCQRIFQHGVSFRQRAGAETEGSLDHANFAFDPALHIERPGLALS